MIPAARNIVLKRYVVDLKIRLFLRWVLAEHETASLRLREIYNFTFDFMTLNNNGLLPLGMRNLVQIKYTTFTRNILVR